MVQLIDCALRVDGGTIDVTIPKSPVTKVIHPNIRERAKMLYQQGVPNTQIATQCEVSRQTVIRWSKRPDFVRSKPSVPPEELNRDRVAESFAAEFKKRVRQNQPYYETRPAPDERHGNEEFDLDVMIAEARHSYRFQMYLAEKLEWHAHKLSAAIAKLTDNVIKNPDFPPKELPAYLRALESTAAAAFEARDRAMNIPQRIKCEIKNTLNSVLNADDISQKISRLNSENWDNYISRDDVDMSQEPPPEVQEYGEEFLAFMRLYYFSKFLKVPLADKSFDVAE